MRLFCFLFVKMQIFFEFFHEILLFGVYKGIMKSGENSDIPMQTTVFRHRPIVVRRAVFSAVYHHNP